MSQRWKYTEPRKCERCANQFTRERGTGIKDFTVQRFCSRDCRYPDPGANKICSLCRALKPPTEFYVNQRSGRPINPCRSCHVARGAVWVEENRARAQQYSRTYRQGNPERARESSRAHRLKNRALFTERQRLYREKYPEKYRALNAASNAKAFKARGTAGYVYFIQCETGFIKIGFATGNPEARLVTLQSGNHEKISLLGFVCAERQEEARLHLLFRSLRHRGEWFRPQRELLEYIKTYATIGDEEEKRSGESPATPGH